MKPESASKSDFRSLRPILASFASTSPKTSCATVFSGSGSEDWILKVFRRLAKVELLFSADMPPFGVSCYLMAHIHVVRCI
jgi:hypothetical protein